MPYSIAELNEMEQSTFVTVLGPIFEDTPVIALETWSHRPFKDLAHLHYQMNRIIQNWTTQEVINLIRAHPDLAPKTKMAAASVAEQASIGLDRLSPEEFKLFSSLNQAYRQKFGFPFIIAVKDHTKESILTAFAQRLQHDPLAEIEEALAQISRIAWFRLQDKITYL